MTIWLLACALAPGCATAPPPVLSNYDQSTLAEIQTYLDGLRAFHARFNESGTDGVGDGVLWVDRPGRLRVEFIHPHAKLLLANHGHLLLADEATGATTTMPVSRTPLDILLAEKIILSGTVTITSMQREPGMLQISLVKAAAPGQGRLTLQFDTNPWALRGVVVRDGSGRTNSFDLYGLHRDTSIDPALFQYGSPAAAR
jgi:outer membrane lipoprotein-sorting protein